MSVNPLKILVVDDEADWEDLILQSFETQIEEKKWEFFFARNGLEGLQKLEEIPEIDVILLDINMPKMDGFGFLKKLNAMHNPIIRKTIIITAYGDMENIRKAMNLGAFDFINKPIDFSDLEITIDKSHNQINFIRGLIERSDEFEKDIEISAQIQRAMLPNVFPPFPDRKELDIYAETFPAKIVGGDFFDFFFIDPNKLGFLVGDVSDKGIPAALYMAKCSTLLKSTAKLFPDPGECLHKINNLLIPDTFRKIFVTIMYGVLDIPSGELSYACGGHPAPYLIRSDGSVTCLPRGKGVFLGKIKNTDFKTCGVTLNKNDSIFVYSDGIIEAMDGKRQQFDHSRLQKFLRENHHATGVNNNRLCPRTLITDLITEIRNFIGGAPQSDDITMLLLRYNGTEKS